MKVSKKKLALYWAFFLVGLALHDNVDWHAVGMICIIIGLCRLSEIDGFRRGYLAAFSGEKE